MPGEIEGQDAAQIDVLVSDRRDPAQNVVGIVGQGLVEHCLEPVCIPRHNDVGEQGQGARDGAELLGGAAAFGGDRTVVDGALKAMDGFALVEKIEDLRSEHRVAEVIAEIKAPKQLPELVAAGVNRIAAGGRAKARERGDGAGVAAG